MDPGLPSVWSDPKLILKFSRLSIERAIDGDGFQLRRLSAEAEALPDRLDVATSVLIASRRACLAKLSGAKSQSGKFLNRCESFLGAGRGSV